ncbi:MAG: rod-binding protein [Clostridiales bacterium]|jgi:flagellar protein FlgJ|nr:rod-binding protein [Clostridiales bacterium]
MDINMLTGLGYMPVSSASTTGADAAAMYRMESNKTDAMEAAVYAAQDKSDAELMEACRSFESYFIQMMFKELRKTSLADESGPFAKSGPELIFQDMLDEQVSIQAANGGGIGIAAFMYKQMKRNNPVMTFEEYDQMQEQMIQESEAVDEQL